jgi:type III pantothenate kinase
MLLAMDVGNTNITLGVFEIESGKAKPGPVNIWRLATNLSSTSDEYGTKILDFFHYSMIDLEDIKAVAVASVVPVLDGAIEELSLKYFKKRPFFVKAESQKYLKVLNDNPSEIGADRVANAAAAIEFFKTPCVVIDFGTATTFDCINKKGEYMGGVIIPGPRIAAEALSRRTAKLPRVDIKKTDKVICKSTVQSIQSGLYYGYVGMIKELLRKVVSEIGGKPVIIATGGLADIVLNDIREVEKVVPELTLEGIRIIWEKGK